MGVAEPYVMESHRPVKLASLSWMYCIRCGLVYLKNDFSQWAIRKGCNNDDHPDYKRQRSMATKR